MIANLLPLAGGNAVRVFLEPDAGFPAARVLRNLSGVFAGPADPAATVVEALTGETYILDTDGLTNGQIYYYRAWGTADDGATWVDGGVSVAVTPAASYADPSTDPQELVRSRLEAGLAVEVARGFLKPQSGKIAVNTAPFVIAAGVKFPTCSVHLDNATSGDRALGESMNIDEAVGDHWEATEGWMAHVRLNVVAVSLNSDERIALRKAIRRIIILNLPVFDARGLVQISFTQTDTEQYAENSAPLYFSAGTFDCLVPAFIVETEPSIADVDVFATTYHGAISDD
jgi:hypothetical protein